MTSKTNTLTVLFVVLLSGFLTNCASAPKITGPLRPWQTPALPGFSEKSVEAFGTKFVIRVWPSNKPTVPVEQALDAAIAEINRVAKLTDADIDGSEVALINKTAYKEAVPVSEEMAAILIDCNKMYQLSGLKFDVTYVPYKNRDEFTDADYNRITDWDKKEPPIASSSLRLFGDQNMILDVEPAKKVRFYNQRIKLNLKGMIRGYAVDKAMHVLMKQGLGGFAVIADGFFGAIGTPTRDPSLMCIENPVKLGSCLYHLTASEPRKILYIGTSASQERPGRAFDPNDTWSFRSGGVVVAGESGAWTQFATTITAVMEDLALNAFFKRTTEPKISGSYFIKNRNGAMDGDLAPFVTVK